MMYTRNQIKGMSERELNVLAAKHVMDMNVNEEASEHCEAAVIECFEGDERCWWFFKPTSEMSAATDLLEHIEDVELRKSIDNDCEPIYTVRIGAEFLITGDRQEWPKIITQAVILATLGQGGTKR